MKGNLIMKVRVWNFIEVEVDVFGELPEFFIDFFSCALNLSSSLVYPR